MTREVFLKQSIAIGLGLPFLSSFLTACGEADISVPQIDTNFTGKVLIVGAGAAGLAAGYLLNRHNIDFQIIEATADFGGRVKRTDNFVDFPIDMGAEWIHVSPAVLADILGNTQLDASIDFITYNPQTIQTWNGGALRPNNFASNLYSEFKFKNTTWYGFLETYLVPAIADRIIYEQPIEVIDYHSDKVVLESLDKMVFEADKVVVTVPIKVLQENQLTFRPALPADKLDAINSIYMGDGLKAFIEFREKFYPDILFEGGLIENLSSDDKIFYDAAFRKDTRTNVLGLFTINERAAAYTNLSSEAAIIEAIIAELDLIFAGQASQHYVRHIVQNWSGETYIKGSYSSDFAQDQLQTVNTIKQPIDNKVFFAGEALSIDHQATVHGACASGFAAVEQLFV